MESKHLMIIGIISLFLLQNIILLEPQSHTNNNMDKIIFNNVSPSQLYYSYNISIHNSPSGNGYYQQLITLKNYSIYNINSNGSNFYVAYENNTLIYTWVQSINKTVISFWSKILNGTSEIKIDVYNNKTNLFSSNGHIGLAPQYSSTYGAVDNGKMVFPFYEDFKSGILRNFTTNYAQYLTFSNGLKILDGNSSLTVLSNISQGNSGTVLWNGEFNTGTSNTTISKGTTTGPLYLGFQFTGNLANGFIWLNATAHPTQFMYDNSFSSGSNANYLTNTFQNYMVQTNESANGTQYMGFFLNNSEQQNAYTYNRNYSGNFGFSTQQQSVAYEIWHYVAETSFLFSKMPTFTQSTNQFYSLNIISKNNGTIINNSYIYNGLFYSNNYINFTVNYSKFSNFYVYALNYSTNFPQYTQFLLTINNYTDNNSGLYYFGTLTILYHTQSIKPLRETTFTQYNMYFLIVIIIFILGLIIYGYKRG